MARLIACLVMVIVCSMAFVAGLQAEENDGKALLQEASSWAAGLESLSGTVDIKMDVKMEEDGQEIALSTALAMAGKDNLYMKLDDGNSAAEVTGNKETYTVYFAEDNEYMEAEGKPRVELLGMMGHGPIREGAYVLADLLHNETEWLDEAKAIHYKGEATLPLPESTEQARHFLIETEDYSFDLWMGLAEAPLPRLIRMDLSAMMQRMMNQPEGLSVKVDLSCSDWQPNKPIDPAKFVFTPPEGAKKATPPGQGSEEKDPLLGKAAQDFTLELLKGGEVSLSKHKGKDIVILDFWATWCGPCRTALPIVAGVAADYAEKNVAFYAVNQAEEPKTIQAFLDRSKLEIPVALDSKSKVAQLFGVRGIPRMVIIDKEGIIQVVHVGASPNLKAELTKDLDDLIAGKKPAEEK